MNNYAILSKENFKRQTWKNGLGFTDEIAIYPENAELKRGNFLWRLSSAQIQQASSFSVFPQHDRVLMILKGEGVRLTHTFEADAEEEVNLPPLSAYEFPGDVPSRCELVSGTVTDLSVFIRKAEVEAMVDSARVEEGESFHWVPSGRWNFAYVNEGCFRVASAGSSKTDQLEAGNALQLELHEAASEADALTLGSVRGTGTLVLVSLQG